MDKAEALDFIGLKEPLTEETVLAKYTERFNYNHMLYANAPSKVIEKIQQQSLEKLTRVKHILLEDIAAKKAAFDERFAGPTVNQKPEPAASENKQVVAWLILNTENKKTETFTVYEGINYIGRKKKEDGGHTIVLFNDPF